MGWANSCAVHTLKRNLTEEKRTRAPLYAASLKSFHHFGIKFLYLSLTLASISISIFFADLSIGGEAHRRAIATKVEIVCKTFCIPP